MLSLLTGYSAISKGMKELKSIQDDRRAVLTLLARARSEGAPADLKAAIVLALGRHAGAETLDALEDVLRTERAWRARAAATVALGSINDPRSRELLALAETDAHRRVRENARFNKANPGAFAHL